MIEFIKEYYYLIVLILALVILILECILSFRVKPNQNILSFIDKIVPDLVKSAEDIYGAGHGEDKLLYVFRNVSTSLANVFNIQNAGTYEKYINERVEKTLSTPQKKEA